MCKSVIQHVEFEVTWIDAYLGPPCLHSQASKDIGCGVLERCWQREILSWCFCFHAVAVDLDFNLFLGIVLKHQSVKSSASEMVFAIDFDSVRLKLCARRDVMTWLGSRLNVFSCYNSC